MPLHRLSVAPLYSASFGMRMFAHAIEMCVPPSDRTKRSRRKRRTDDSGLPWSTGGRYGGVGGHEWFDTDPGVTRPPVVFVHGNGRTHDDWTDHAEYLLDSGFAGDDLWAITFAHPNPTHREMVRQLDEFVREVRSYTGSDTVSVVAHSLGVTGVRYWMARRDRYDWVDTFVAIAGANHGVSLCTGEEDPALFGEYGRSSRFVGYRYRERPNHPLKRLNAGDETPGDVTYYTIRGAYDHYYWHDTDSPTLEGAAENVLLWTNHVGTLRSDETRALLSEWLASDADRPDDGRCAERR
jgi:pimeloyl-ACP methyl ester carboxylesterase